MDQLRIGIVGGYGWIGRAIYDAVLRDGFIDPQNLILAIRSSSTTPRAPIPNVRVTNDLRVLVEYSDVVILAVRPQHFVEIKLHIPEKLVVSIMAGVSIAHLGERTGAERIVRAMPNAAISARCSYTPWFAPPTLSLSDSLYIDGLLSCCGATDRVPSESQLDYLTALTGSGPAFPAVFADAMLKHALLRGIPPSIAERAIRQTMTGAVVLMNSEGITPAALVTRFLEYDGTTARGIDAMYDNGFIGAVHAGIDAAAAAAQTISTTARIPASQLPGSKG